MPEEKTDFFKMDRKIFESDIWLQPVELRLFIYLIGQARHSEKPNKKYKSFGIIIEKGQYLKSYRKIQDDLEYIENNAVKTYSLSRIKRAIDNLIKQDRISTEKTELGTLFTVSNYCYYQGWYSKNEEHRTDLERSRNADGTQMERSRNNTNKGNKGNKGNKEKNSSDSDESSNEPIEVKFNSESMPYKAAKYLRQLILENNQREPVPDEDPNSLEDWAIEIDRLNRLGPVGAKGSENKGYSWKEIGRIMEWSQDHHFWKQNIKSASKFRKQITRLEDQMKNSDSNKQKEKDDILKRTYEKYKNEEESVDVL